MELPCHGKLWAAERTHSHWRQQNAPKLALGPFPTKLKAPLAASQHGSPGANNLAR